MLSGKHLIAGQWVAGNDLFSSSPATGPSTTFSIGTATHVNKAAVAAEDAFGPYSQISRTGRAAFLNCIADEIEARGAVITDIASAETGLPVARLDGERAHDWPIALIWIAYPQDRLFGHPSRRSTSGSQAAAAP